MKNNKLSLYKTIAIYILVLFSIPSFSQKELKKGTLVSNIIAEDNHNNKINLYKLLEEKPVVVIFYRGEWCKFCNLYMRDLADSLSFITDAGANIIAVTPESNLYIDETVGKTQANFSIIYDDGHKIMDAYKVTWNVSSFANFFYRLRGINLDKANRNSDRALPVPATYIIGTDKKIAGGYFNEDYTKRMPVSDIVKVLKTTYKKKM